MQNILWFYMNTFSKFRLIVSFSLLGVFSFGQEMKSLTSTSGASIQATIIKVEGEKVYMRRSDGVSFQVSITIFDLHRK